MIHAQKWVFGHVLILQLSKFQIQPKRTQIYQNTLNEESNESERESEMTLIAKQSSARSNGFRRI